MTHLTPSRNWHATQEMMVVRISIRELLFTHQQEPVEKVRYMGQPNTFPLVIWREILRRNAFIRTECGKDLTDPSHSMYIIVVVHLFVEQALPGDSHGLP